MVRMAGVWEVGRQIRFSHVMPFGWIVANRAVDVVDDELVRHHNLKAANAPFHASACPDVDEAGGPEMINHILR